MRFWARKLVSKLGWDDRRDIASGRESQAAYVSFSPTCQEQRHYTVVVVEDEVDHTKVDGFDFLVFANVDRKRQDWHAITARSTTSPSSWPKHCPASYRPTSLARSVGAQLPYPLHVGSVVQHAAYSAVPTLVLEVPVLVLAEQHVSYRRKRIRLEKLQSLLECVVNIDLAVAADDRDATSPNVALA